MRHIFTLALTLVIICGLCGCTNQNPTVSFDNSSESSQSVSTSAVVESEQVQENKKAVSSSQTKSEKAESSSESAKTNSSPTSKTSTSITSKSAVSSKPKSQSKPISIEKLKNWDSLYGKKEWMLFTTEPSRQRYEGSTAFVCRFSAGQDTYATIFVESYCLLDKWKYPLNDTIVTRTINGHEYVQTFSSKYKGSFYTFVGGEDIITLELRCYDATGRNWLSDELKFKRTGNNSLQLISGNYEEFGLKTGDVFVR